MTESERNKLAETLAAARNANGGRLPHGMAKQAAEAAGYSTKTAQRDAKKGSYQRPHRERQTPAPLTQLERDQIALAHNNCAAAYRRLPADQRGSYSTFMRRVAADLSAATRADMKDGDAARRSNELKVLRAYSRPFEVLVVDEKFLSIEVEHPTTGEPISPVVGHVRDAFSGAVAGAAASPSGGTNHHDHLRALADALDKNSDIFPRGGLPEALQWDQGPWHTADEVTAAVTDWHVPIVVIDGYHPHLNGIVEAFHNFVELDYCRTHPFYLHGRRALDGKRQRPNYDALPSWDEFWVEYRAWLHWYNHEWRQRLRGNRTPLEVWDEAEREPAAIDQALIDPLLVR